jgi:hypothetical protein
MKKKLNEEAVMSELREGSLHFRRPPEEPHRSETPVATAASGQGAEPAQGVPLPVERPYGRTTVRTVQRVLKRHPFEFYQDQLDALKRISLSDQMAGGKGNMSEMVREAIDEYLAKRNGHQREE